MMTEIAPALLLVASVMLVIVGMGRQYLSLETAVVAAADTEIELVDLGGDVPSRIVEKEMTRVKRIIVAVAADGAAVGAAVIWLRLFGSGIGQAEVSLMVGGYGGTLITTGGQSIMLAELKDLDIKVKAGSAIRVSAQMNLDIGSVAVGATLELE